MVIILFYYLITSIASLILGMIQPILGIPGVVIQVTQFGPALGVLAILLLWPRVIRPFLTPDIRFWRLQPHKIIVAGTVLIVTFAAAWLWYSITGHSVTYTSPSSLSHPFWLIIIAQFVGAAGEEIGWRCFLQPALQSRIGVLPASVIVGILWGIWHVGVFAEGWGYALLFILFAVFLSIILGELLSDARGGRLLLAASYHALMNLGLLLWFNEEDGSLLAIGTLATSCAIAAVMVMVHGRMKSVTQHATIEARARSKNS
ncbi:CPBP family intramembrane glutamic endopeptidase [Cytobacillus dafuensis]|uniref:CPBP family intramembrane metalloprotease n=1 Tax=Cytobacillus dafuensis TaxID=1742359 RepID=A0A5B8Z9C1_CYTDA|nr:type II CAAX endopeptidase family protein [Cytobacillus dafuensis]QED49568.1 CPBP family intramembrane metalloprotease [Cytobacillus dafuensis]